MTDRFLRRARSFLKPPSVGLIAVVVAWWLLMAGAVALTLPAPAASATPTPLAVAAGQLARIHQPGMPSWPIPTEWVAFAAYQRGAREGDETAMEQAFTRYEWIEASHGQAVWIVAVDGEAIQVELLEGPHEGRRAWLKARNLGPLQ